MEKILSSNDENYINNNPNEDVKNIFIKDSINILIMQIMIMIK